MGTHRNSRSRMGERKGGGGLMPKRGSYDYGFVYNEVKKNNYFLAH